ncbi:unnamed protein product, partial [Timema podura]|nr:unnamed protein product [Timema podura]
MKSPSVRGKSV